MKVIGADRSLVYTVEAPTGEILSEFQFDGLGIHPNIAGAFMRAMRAQFGHTSLESQRQSWRCVRKLVAFLRESMSGDATVLPETVAEDFRDWLERSGLNPSTAQSALNCVLSILTWCRRNAPDIIDRRTRLLVRGFVRGQPETRKSLDGEALKRILSACYTDIENVERRLSTGRRVLSGECRTDSEIDLGRLLNELLGIGKGVMPTQRTIGRSGACLSRRVDEAGGLRELSRSLWVTPDLMFPFYLAIVIQTSGNPMAIAELGRACIKQHPIREDLERLTWEKRRAKREQRAEFPVGREWSAPSLVRRLCSINEDLVDYASPKDKGKLFIAMLPTRKSRRPCFQLFHVLLDQFIDRHDLPKFDFRDLRKAGALAHHKASGNMNAARSRLNHASLSTTNRYTDPSTLRVHHEKVIRGFQGEIVRLSSSRPRVGQVQGGISATAPAATVFGFDCRDPLGGINGEVPRGTMCTHFHRCATCPGAVIPLDDLEVVARLLSASRALQGARDRSLKEGWWPRFEHHYEPTRRILEEEILPAVDPSVLALAEASATAQAIVWLE